MAVIDEAHDAFGRAILDHHEGRRGWELLLERDDGSIGPADVQPEDFFLPHAAWPSWERAAIARAQGSVLDLGAGAGRHSLHLQGLGNRVTAVDVSPGCVAVCRARGIADVRLVDLRTLTPGERWDSILLMCGNLGLGGDLQPSLRLLSTLADLTNEGGLLIGDSVDPTSEDPLDLAYEERNRAAGFHRGHVRLRLRYRDLVSPWWDQINLVPADLEGLLERTGWALEERIDADDGYAVILRRR
jgi:SAM-dependent methyltransferase